MKKVTCGALSADPDKLAPVSGCRCRDCGANARRKLANEEWAIINSAAYCTECAPYMLASIAAPVKDGIKYDDDGRGYHAI